MNIPSTKTLKAITSYPRELRLLLECRDWNQIEQWLAAEKPFGAKSDFERFHPHGRYENWVRHDLHHVKMSMADELCETHGVEYTPKGHNAKSPAIEYCNAGDTYAATLLWVNGRYRVGCWGDIVERGEYD